MKRKILYIVYIIGGTLLLLGGMAFYLFLTTQGSRTVIKKFLSDHEDRAQVEYDGISGNLLEGVRLKDLNLTNVKGLPEGSTVKIQELYVNLTSLNIEGLTVEVQNARIKLPVSDPIVVFGSFKGGQWDVNVFGLNVDLSEVLRFFPSTLWKKVEGQFAHADIYVEGNYLQPVFKGKFHLARLNYKKFSLTEAPGFFELQLKEFKPVNLSGRVNVSQGTLQSKDVNINIEDSQFYFSGNFKDPALFVNGNSTVEKTKISLTLRGTLKQPELKLTSDPPKPQGQLLLMLATGEGWEGLETSLEQGTLDAELTKDFIDYFILGGTGSKMARKLGIHDVNLTYEKDVKGIGAKKSITDKLSIGYDIEERHEQEKLSPTVSQTVGGEYQLTDAISMGVEREFTDDPNSPDIAAQEEAIAPLKEDRVFLKYEKRF
ncbi:MAG: translocation/assembly module TamB domain-containing protein [Candidatus Omnitrophica bacterium]|nr:translocation/assembly module TamB domain-containing protein [Candidatus Omnitrophota bacterium]